MNSDREYPSEGEAVTALVERCFDTILETRMAGMPILNGELRVEARGFHLHEGRWLGVVVTPWLMSLVMLPGEEGEWDGLTLGESLDIALPARDYTFTVNEFDGLGRCLTHALHSPMFDFTDQESALAMADVVLIQIDQEGEAPEPPSEEERRIEEYLRKETMFDPATELQGEQGSERKPLSKEAISRRDLLFSTFRDE